MAANNDDLRETAAAFMESVFSSPMILSKDEPEEELKLELDELTSKYDDIPIEPETAPEPEPTMGDERDVLQARLDNILSGDFATPSDDHKQYGQSAPEPGCPEMVTEAQSVTGHNESDSKAPTANATDGAGQPSGETPNGGVVESRKADDDNQEASNEATQGAPEPGQDFADQSDPTANQAADLPPPPSCGAFQTTTTASVHAEADDFPSPPVVDSPVVNAPEPQNDSLSNGESNKIEYQFNTIFVPSQSDSVPEPAPANDPEPTPEPTGLKNKFTGENLDINLAQSGPVQNAPEPAQSVPEPVPSAPEPSQQEMKDEATKAEEEDKFPETSPIPRSPRSKHGTVWSIADQPSPTGEDKFRTIRQNIKRGNTLSLKEMWERMSKK